MLQGVCFLCCGEATMWCWLLMLAIALWRHWCCFLCDIPLGTSSFFWYKISDAVNVQESHKKRLSESWRRFPFVARSARVAPKNWVSSPQSISKCTLTLSRSWFHFAGKYTLIWANTTRAYKIYQTSALSVVYKRNLRSFLWSLWPYLIFVTNATNIFV